MSIDKESTGLPSVNVHQRTTKVNLWMLSAVVFFFVVMAVIAVWVSRGTGTPDPSPPPSNQTTPAAKN